MENATLTNDSLITLDDMFTEIGKATMELVNMGKHLKLANERIAKLLKENSELKAENEKLKKELINKRHK